MTWPELNYSEWKPTYETLHRWVQIIGKLRLSQSPWANHSWNSTLYLTSRGFTTSPLPLDERNLTVDLDFIEHRLVIQDSTGRFFEMPLMDESVATFYRRFMDALSLFDVTPVFGVTPNELPDAIPFDQDYIHGTYDRLQAFDCFRALIRVSNVLQEFKSEFVGKCSPVHFFWGSFDLAVTRFSGKRAPEHPGGMPHISDDVVKEAYSHEVMSCGFWPGNEMYPHAAFYAYAYPEPKGFSSARIMPPEAYYHPDLKEFILDYETVRISIDPAKTIKSFFDTAYRATADLGKWDRDILEVSPYLSKMRDHSRYASVDQATRQ